MQTLRRAHFLARLVLVWFALSLGVAAASPLVQPRVMELVCSSAGMVKILVQTDDGMQEVSNHTLDCPLCLAAGARRPLWWCRARPSHPWPMCCAASRRPVLRP